MTPVAVSPSRREQMMSDDDERFEVKRVPCGRQFLANGLFTLNTLGPLPGVNAPRWRMRDWGEVQVSRQGSLLCIATHLEVVPALDGGDSSIGGDLEYVLTEEQRRVVARIRGWGNE